METSRLSEGHVMNPQAYKRKSGSQTKERFRSPDRQVFLKQGKDSSIDCDSQSIITAFLNLKYRKALKNL